MSNEWFVDIQIDSILIILKNTKIEVKTEKTENKETAQFK